MRPSINPLDLSPRPTPVEWNIQDRTPAAPMALNVEETHLWFTDLDQQVQDETVDFLLTLLDSQERERALRFRFPQLTERFVTAHGRLRQILGAYLGQPPEAVQFCYGNRGKPGLDSARQAQLGPCEEGQTSPQRLQFNLSHSDRYALIAVSHYPVGVDVERLQAFPSASSLAKRFFSAKEFEVLQLLNDSVPEASPPKSSGEEDFGLDRSVAFLRHWVCKEAYVKATGHGLMDQLHQVSLAFRPQAHFTALPDAASGSLPWQVMELTPSPNTLAALVLPREAPLRCQFWKI